MIKYSIILMKQLDGASISTVSLEKTLSDQSDLIVKLTVSMRG